jgi:isopenicillin-N N-acyltransferase-like protein
MTVRRFETDELDPYARGFALGRFGAEEIAANVAGYRELFEVVGVQPDDLPRLGRQAADTIEAWAPALGAELRGQADGAGLERWQLGILNARTEILATVGAIGEGECSTSVVLPETGAPLTVQTWDWHDVSNEDTLVVRYLARPGHEVRYFTEFGILGKIGVNSAGIGVHFNILNHSSDGEGIGVPVHAVARQVLERATSLDGAIEIAQSATVTASTVLTIVSYRDGRADASCVELSSGGTAVVRPADDGILLHTNHFLDAALASGEMVPGTSSTYPRLEHLRARLDALTSPDAVERASVGMLVHEADGAPVCCHPDPTMSFEHRWQTLLTISLDVDGGHLQFHEGGPCTVTRESWQVF